MEYYLQERSERQQKKQLESLKNNQKVPRHACQPCQGRFKEAEIMWCIHCHAANCLTCMANDITCRVCRGQIALRLCQ